MKMFFKTNFMIALLCWYSMNKLSQVLEMMERFIDYIKRSVAFMHLRVFIIMIFHSLTKNCKRCAVKLIDHDIILFLALTVSLDHFHSY